MKHIVAYSHLPGLEKTGVLAPMLPITFINGDNEISTIALVDSGAESGMISTVIAEELGINWVKLPQYTGFTSSGRFAYRFFENLTVESFNNNFSMNISIAEGVNAFKCILGRKDIFRKAKVTFEGYKNQFSIEFRRLN